MALRMMLIWQILMSPLLLLYRTWQLTTKIGAEVWLCSRRVSEQTFCLFRMWWSGVVKKLSVQEWSGVNADCL